MKIDLAIALCSPFATPEFLRTLGVEAEAHGFHGVWIGDHVLRFESYESRYPYTEDGHRPAWPGDGLLEPFSALTFLAACTSRLRLGIGVLILPQRNPVYVASQIAAVDWLSNGRIDLGIGVGWSEQEFRAVQAPFEGRGRRTDDYVAVLRTLWCDDPSSHAGPFYQLPLCHMHPKPIQKPHPPIHIGGNTDAALRRVAALAQGWYGLGLTPRAVAERVQKLDGLLGARGRTRDGVEISVATYNLEMNEEDVAAYARAGVTRLLAGIRVNSPDAVKSALDALGPCVDAVRAQ